MKVFLTHELSLTSCRFNVSCLSSVFPIICLDITNPKKVTDVFNRICYSNHVYTKIQLHQMISKKDVTEVLNQETHLTPSWTFHSKLRSWPLTSGTSIKLISDTIERWYFQERLLRGCCESESFNFRNTRLALKLSCHIIKLTNRNGSTILHLLTDLIGMDEGKIELSALWIAVWL